MSAFLQTCLSTGRELNRMPYLHLLRLVSWSSLLSIVLPRVGLWFLSNSWHQPKWFESSFPPLPVHLLEALFYTVTESKVKEITLTGLASGAFFAPCSCPCRPRSACHIFRLRSSNIYPKSLLVNSFLSGLP